MKNLLSLKDLILIKKHYSNLGLPANIKKIFDKNKINKIIYFMKNDKKNSNQKINLILIKKIGKVIKPSILNVGESELKKFFHKSYN